MAFDYLQPDRAHSAPLYQQLYQRYRTAIASGQLRPGERVASVRSLASELQLARGTVELAYQQLVSEGYLVSRGPAGTFVCDAVPGAQLPHPLPAPIAAPRRVTSPAASPRPFQLGFPALDAFPLKAWTRLASQVLRSEASAGLVYPEPGGDGRLRRAIAGYLAISRGISCDPEQIFITAGYRGALQLICRALLQVGDCGWFEDPGFPIAREYLRHSGMRLHPVAVDDEGLAVHEALRTAPAARFAVVTPTHQSPTGAGLSLARRLALLAWAQQQQSWIIEDDYDSEFRYHGRPLPALKSLDRADRVIYCGTFSKSLFPGLGLAWLVAPASTVETFNAATRHLPLATPLLPQVTTARFIEQGHFARHLRRMRVLYAERRHYLACALEAEFDSLLAIQPQAGGIQILANLASTVDDKRLTEYARKAGLAVNALSHWQLRPPLRRGLLMGFTNVTSPQMAAQWAERLRLAMPEK